MIVDCSPLSAARRFCAGAVRAFGLLVLLVGLVACDSNDGGPPPSDLEGTYVFSELRFTVAGVDNFNILADTLVASSNSPRMEFFGGNATVNLIYRLEGDEGSSLLAGQFSTRNDRVIADFSKTEESTRFQILLPSVLRLQREDDGNRLVADQSVNQVDLRKYSPDRYGGLTQPVNGTLRMVLERQPPQ